MSENITVAVRVRPLNETEFNNHEECIWSIDPTQTMITLSSNYLCDLIVQGNVNNLPEVNFNFCIAFVIL